MTAGQFPKRNYAPRPRKTRPGAGQDDQRPVRQGGHRKDRPDRPDRAPPAGRKDQQPPVAAQAPGPAAETAWEPQATWYDQHQGDRGDDFYIALVLPAVLRQLQARAGDTILDVCCGQGVLGRVLAEHGIASLGIDASPTLIKAATSRARTPERYRVGDARSLQTAIGQERFDHAALVMALQDLDPIQPVLAGIAAAVKPGGRVVMVMTHPVFRIPRRTTWGFDEDTGVQYRRLDGYMSPMRLPIRTHPGMPNDTTATSTFHRPLHTYITACGQSGLGIIGCEELCSHRRGTKGPRFGAEDRAAKEFPVFLVLTAVRLPDPSALGPQPVVEH